MDMFDGFRLPMSLARSPLGTLADRSARGRRLNIRDILGVRFSALPTPPRKQPWRTLVASGFLTSVENTLGAGPGSNHRKRWLLRVDRSRGSKRLSRPEKRLSCASVEIPVGSARRKFDG